MGPRVLRKRDQKKSDSGDVKRTSNKHNDNSALASLFLYIFLPSLHDYDVDLSPGFNSGRVSLHF